MTTLRQAKRVYFIGIKGAGMTALAQVLKGWGKTVSGSDTADIFFTDDVLKKEKIRVVAPFRAGNLPAADLVIRSTAYTASNNVEVKTAVKKKLPMMTYPQAVGQLFAGRYGIAVCGTHGKTTTSAMLTFVLKELGLDPTAIIGSAVPQLGGSACVGQGQYLVVEADEYQNKLRHYRPRAIILTSADWDHPDYFKNQAAYNRVFIDFIKRLPKDGLLIAFQDDKNVRVIAKHARCRVVWYGKKGPRLPLAVPGDHNQWNAAAVVTLCQSLTLPKQKVIAALKRFTGTKRRFELLGEKKGVKVYDDYAHHPAEVIATLQAVRQQFKKNRLIVAFQSHTYTRTKALLPAFAKAFRLADEVIVLDIFGSAREKHGSITPEKLAAAIHRQSRNASYRGNFSAVVDYLTDHVRRGDVVIVMGAGENWKVGVGLLKKLK